MSIKVITALKDNFVEEVLSYFSKDEPVALPTETVYGLAAPVSRSKAVARIYEIKERPAFNPLIVHVKEDWDLSRWAEINEVEEKLIKTFWPGPLSILLKKKNISDLITAGSDKVVMRAPSHPLFRKILNKLREPLVAPSANSSTKLSPTTALAVAEDLGTKLEAVLEGGRCEWGVESTIVEVQSGKIVILREGAISKEQLEEKGFRVSVGFSTVQTPGSQLRHYAPTVPLKFFDSVEEWSQKNTPDLLLLKVLDSDAPHLKISSNLQALAPDNDFKTAASNLFEFLRKAQTQYKEIRVLKTRDELLGRAINDRLKRASQN